MNRTHDRRRVRRILGAVALPLLLIVLILPLGAAASPPAVQLEGGTGGAASGPIVVNLLGSSGDPIGGERLPPRVIDEPLDPGGIKIIVTDDPDGSGLGVSGSAGFTGGTTWGRGWMFMPPLAGLSLLLLHLRAGVSGGPAGLGD